MRERRANELRLKIIMPFNPNRDLGLTNYIPIKNKMKKIYILIFMCLMATMAKAQVYGNLQVQYDYGHNYGTLTTEIGHTQQKTKMKYL